MIGLVVVTHGQLADHYVQAALHVLGDQKQLVAIGVKLRDDLDETRRSIVDAIRLVDDGSGVIVLTDMFGATPSNLALEAAEGEQVEIIAGFNLPTLLHLVMIRDRLSVEVAAVEAANAGRRLVTVASEVLPGEGGPRFQAG